MTVLFASIREKGKSIAEIAKDALGNTGFFLFISFAILMLLLLTSSFLGLTAVSLTSAVPLDMLKLDSGQTIVNTIMINGLPHAQIGGISSMSLIIITSFSPVLGFLVYKKNVSVKIAMTLAIVVCIGSILVGMRYPVALDPDIWMIILCFYTLLAAGIPVWIILQPRDFTNSFLLYIGVAALFIGGMAAGLQGVTFSAPALNVAQGSGKLGPLWPFLFITVACGAVSGFHSLVAGGTSSKQLSKESHAKTIAFGGMLLEGLLAIGVVIAIGSGMAFSDYVQIVFPETAGVKANPILAFAIGVGGLLDKALGIPPVYGTIFGILMVEGFVITTLDTAVRLNRYLFEELWQVIFINNVPAFMKSYLFNALLCVALMFFLAYTNAFSAIWPIFGAANQLMASLALLAVSAWLIKRKKPSAFTVWPALFMLVTTLYALVSLLINTYIPRQNTALAMADILLLILCVSVTLLAGKQWWQIRSNPDVL